MKRKRIYLLVLFLIILLYPLIDGNAYRLYVMNRAIIHAILVTGIVFLTGFAGQISLGQAGFYAIGAYVSSILSVRLGMPVVFSILIAVLVSLVAGLILSIPSFKLKAFFLSLVTIAFGQVVWVLLLNLDGLTGGANGLFAIPRFHLGSFLFDDAAYFYLFALFLVIVIYVMYRIKNSYMGRSMYAINNDIIAAETCGINSKRTKIFAFGFASILAGFSGALYAHYEGFLTPEPFVFFESANFVAMAVVGGLHHLAGGVIGGIALTWLPELLRLDIAGFENYYLLFTSLIVILFVVLLPKGLGGLFSEQLARLKERRRVKRDTGDEASEARGREE